MTHWERERVVSAAGVYGAAWTEDNKLIVTSPDGYSITPADKELPQTIRLGKDRPEKARYINNTHYLTEEYPEAFEMFNWDNPIGKCITADDWQISLSKNAGNEGKVVLEKVGSEFNETLTLERLENFDLSFAFSPNDEWLAVIGSGGAEIFKRKTIANKT